MVKRTRLSKGSLCPPPKRTKTSRSRDGDEIQIFEDGPLDSSANTDDHPETTSNSKSRPDTTKAPSANRHPQGATGMNAATIAQNPVASVASVASAPNLANGGAAQSNLPIRRIPSFIPVYQMPPLAWLTGQPQNTAPPAFPIPRLRLSSPRLRISSPELETIVRRRVAKKGKKAKGPGLAGYAEEGMVHSKKRVVAGVTLGGNGRGGGSELKIRKIR